MKEGRTAMHIAADEGHCDVIQVLLDFSAGTNTETIVSYIYI